NATLWVLAVPRAIPLPDCGRQLDSNAAHFKKLFRRNWGRSVACDGVDERRRACALALVLTTEVHLPETLPPIDPKSSETVKLKYRSLREDLEPFLRKRLAAVCEVAYRPY